MSDAVSLRSAGSRASAFLNRPQLAPMGPRTRQSASIRSSRIVSPPSVRNLDLEEFGGMNTGVLPLSPPLSPSLSPALSPGSPVSSFCSDPPSLAAVSEEPPRSVSPILENIAPAYKRESEPEPKPEPESPPPSTLQQPQTPPPAKVVKVAVAPKLVPPPAINFDTTPVQWKGLPLDAALWTVESTELQQIVSRAIRASGRESFVRLLTFDNLDKVLPAELERLLAAKALTQSKYRFLVHRRTMLFQALNSTSLGQQKDGNDGVSVVSRLASQLAETITGCDKHLEELLRINDHIAQVNRLIDLHWSSALAIALRKLNGSYSRRVKDVQTAKERITQLEAELEDAWHEAEKMAKELDDYEQAIEADDTEAVIETAEIVPVPKLPIQANTSLPPLNRRNSIPMTPTLMAVSPIPSQTPPSTTPLSPLSPIQTSFVFPPPVHLKAKEAEAPEDVPDTVSIRSGRSTRSTKSGRSQNHVSSVYAAKTRSHRRSESSLRLNTHVRKHSGASTPGGRLRTPYDDQPPVPELPSQYSASTSIPTAYGNAPLGMSNRAQSAADIGASAGVAALSRVSTNSSNVMHAPSANASSTILHHHYRPEFEFDTRINPHLRRQASLDTVCTNGRRPPGYAQEEARHGRAADDLYVRGHAHKNSGSLLSYESSIRMAQSFDSTIEAVPRTPPYKGNAQRQSGQLHSVLAYHEGYTTGMVPSGVFKSAAASPHIPVKSIPTMWMNVDAGPKSVHPAAPVAATGHSRAATSPTIASNSGSSASPTSPIAFTGSSPLASPFSSSRKLPPNANGHSNGWPTVNLSKLKSSASNPNLLESSGSVSNSPSAYHPPGPPESSYVGSEGSESHEHGLGLGFLTRHASTAGTGAGASGGARNSTYSKLRGLTKRYSVSLPMFNSKLAQVRSASTRRSG